MCTKGLLLSPPVVEFASQVWATPCLAWHGAEGSVGCGPRKAAARPRGWQPLSQTQRRAVPPSVIKAPAPARTENMSLLL